MVYATGNVLPLSEVNTKPRANMAQEDAVEYPIPLSQIRWADGTIPDTTGAAGNPQLVMGGYGSGTGLMRGEDAQAAAKTETVYFDFDVKECYVASETITVSLTCRYNDAGTNTMATKTVDCETYEIAEAGTAGSDICATAIQTITGSMASYAFTITDADVVPGDLLRIFFQIIVEGDSNGVVKAEFGGFTIKLDIKA